MSKQKNTSHSHEEKQSKISIKSKSSFKLALHSNSDVNLRTGKRIKTVSQIMQNIKAKRVKSYQKISFNIRKMDEIFKGTLKSTQKLNLNPQKTKQQSKINKQQKLKTCTNFYQPLKVKKNIISNNHLIQNVQMHVRTKSQQIQQNQQDSFYDKTSSFKKSTIFTTTTSILRSSRHQKPTHAIPGVQFKQQQQYAEQRQSINQNKSSSSIFTQNASTSYLHLSELLSHDHDQRIESMYTIRKESQLDSPPKQWQFYNCLKLNHLSLYRTTLRISCQNWVLIDYLQLKYLRGSDPKQEKEIQVTLILFISSILLHLQSVGFDCQRVKIRINNNLVVQKLQKKQRKDKIFSVANNTIISLWDLFIGLVYTSSTDIIWHFIYVLSHLHQKYNFYLENIAENTEIYETYIFISNITCFKEYQKIFTLLCKGILQRLKLSSFSMEYKHKKYIGMMKNKLLIGEHYNASLLRQQNEVEYLFIKGNCIQTAILFMDCMSFPSFHELFTNPAASIKVRIQYQVGDKFWQWRKHQWIHKCSQSKSKDNFILIGNNIQNKYFSSICYNTKDKGIVVCNDSKANMTPLDCQAVLQWMRKTIKRFQNINKINQ